jgi:diguanylate cyclase (GGDEF)-like protein/PAS domain S-box-containing protein
MPIGLQSAQTDGGYMEPRERVDNYFLRDGAEELELTRGQGEMTEQSRVISAQFEQILDSLPFYVLLVDTDHMIQFANNAFRQTFGVTLAQVQGKYCPAFVHGADHYAGCPVEQAIAGGATEKVHFAAEHGRWLLTTAYPTGAKTKEGLDLYYHTVRDITADKEAREALAASEQKFRRLFEEIEDVIFVMSPDGVLQDMNPAGLALLQIDPREKLSQFNLFTDLTRVDSGWDPFVDALKTAGRVVNHAASFQRPDGRMVIASINARMEQSGPDEVGVIRAIMRDLTRERELEQLSTTDGMTTLYNRGFFQSYLVNKVRHIRAGHESELSVLFVDIDDFKAYNDAYGHQEGDYVLKRVAEAIKAALRGEDVAARYGGEEFTIVLSCDAPTATEVAERVRSTVEDLCSTFAEQRMKRSVTVSVGVATLGPDGENAEKLVNTADARMYEAKKLGKNQVFVGPATMAAVELHTTQA